MDATPRLRGTLTFMRRGVLNVTRACCLRYRADEPTSGLDSRSARVVMTVIQRIAKLGRTVIATIHVSPVDGQPLEASI